MKPFGCQGSCLRFIGSSASRPPSSILAPCLLTSDGPAQETLRAASSSLKVDAPGLYCLNPSTLS